MGKVAVTPAIRVLRRAKVPFTLHEHTPAEHDAARNCAEALGVALPCVLKTIVLQTDAAEPLLALMHGDREVSTKKLARHLGVKSVAPCTAPVAHRHTGYVFGGTSCLGTRRAMPVYAPPSLTELDVAYVNGGRRGLAIEIAPRDLLAVAAAELVEIATG